MAEVESFEQLKDVEADVKVGEFGVESLELGVLMSDATHDGLLTLTYSETIDGVLEWLSRTTSKRPMTFGPPAKFCKILISRLIFFFFTGLSTFTIHFWFVGRWTDSNTCRQNKTFSMLTSEYFPRPTLRTIS